MTKPQIYINTDLRGSDGVLTENWSSVDINTDVNITIKDKIKDSKDVGKVFTAYSNQFKLPASKTNNRVFKRFSNPNIFDGFDPRRKYDALIKLNGTDFKKGYIKLNSVNLKNNMPVSYNVQFFGEITSFKDIIGDAKLKDLAYLSRFKYENNYENVIKGFTSGFDVEYVTGVKEYSYIIVQTPATSDGDIVFSIDGDSYSVWVSSIWTTGSVLVALANYINSNVPNHTAVVDGFLVRVNATIFGDMTDSDFTSFPAGLTAVWRTPRDGEPSGASTGDTITVENPNGNFKYPLISHTRGFEYDDDGFHIILSDEQRDAGHVPDSDDRLDPSDLKPSMKIELIFDAIEDLFPAIKFNKEWLFGKKIGQQQLTSIGITVGPTSSGTIELTLNENTYELSVTSGNTPEEVSVEIANQINAGIEGYVAAANPSGGVGVLIGAIEVGLEEHTTLDIGTTGIVFSLANLDGYISGEEGASTLKDLYIWLHNRKGYLGYETSTGDVQNNVLTLRLTEEGYGAAENNFELLSSNPAEGNTHTSNVNYASDLRRITQDNVYEDTFEYIRQSHRVELYLYDVIGSGDINIEIAARDINSGRTFQESQTFNFDGTSNDDVSLLLEIPFFSYTRKEYEVGFSISANSTINSYLPQVQLRKITKEKDGFFDTTEVTNEYNSFRISTVTASQTYNNFNTINPQLLMPDMKIIDFLSDIFKTYNLVAFEEANTDLKPNAAPYLINIKSLDDYLDSGNQYDITQYIDISDTTVSRISPYKKVNYSYPDPKTFLAINQKEITGDNFGNVTFDVNNFAEEGNTSTNSLLFDGSSYDVKPKFEKMMFERLVNVDSGNLTNYQWGWFVADNTGQNFPNPTIGKPLLHYINNRKAVVGHKIKWSDGTDDYSDYYNAPSNVDDSEENTTHFNSEFDEWNRNINYNSIFSNFHDRYIKGIYSAYAKRFEVKAYLPPAVISKLGLNDTLIIDSVSYIIDSMDININKALTKLNLLRVTDTFKEFEGTTVEEQGGTLSFRIETTSSNQIVELPYSLAGTYNGTVYWGDDSNSFNSYEEREHTYATAGEYVISIEGNASVIDFDLINKTYYKELISFGENSDLDKLSIRGLGSGFDMSSVSDKPNFRPSSVISFYQTNGAINMIEEWDVSNVVTMTDAFSNSNFNQAIGGWDVSNVTNMENMFAFNSSFNKYIGDWNVSNVADMSGMFSFSSSFNENITEWNVSNVLDMDSMFRSATVFNQDISGWNVSNVTDMGSMFKYADAFNQPIGTWDVSSVTDMSGMFNNADSFQNDISDWNLSSITSMVNFMDTHQYSTTYYTNLLTSLVDSGQTNVTLDFDLTHFWGWTSRNILTNDRGWIITDAGIQNQ